MQSILSSFGASAKIDVHLANPSGRAHLTIPAADGSGPQTTYIYSSREDISGEVKVTVMGGKKIEHSGVRVELKGVVELSKDKAPHEFAMFVRDVSGPGVLSGIQAFKFTIQSPDLPAESYTGTNARVRYFLRAIASTKGYTTGGLVKDTDIIVQTVEGPLTPTDTFAGGLGLTSGAGASAPSSTIVAVAAGAGAPASGHGVKLEVGIEDCLHIEFEYDKTRFHLNDVVTGRVDFLLVKIKIKHMEIALIRREAAGVAGAVTNDSETLTRYEVMDGAPIKGERIPIRMHLSGLDLCPSLQNIANCLTVRYFLNLVLVDEEDRRYFKQQEITLYRAEVKGEK